MLRTIFATAWVVKEGWIACTVICALAVAVPAETPQAVIDTFFSKLSAEFDRMADGSALRTVKAAPIDGLFLRTLKRHQVINTLARADAKGRLITEMVRMREPNHDRKSVKKELWFTCIAKGSSECHYMARDSGRYYVVWSKPVMSDSTKGARRLLGVVMMKVDLWDCFHALSRAIEESFLIRLRDRNLYSNKWKKEYRFEELPITLRGAKATLRIQKSAPPPPVAAPAAAPDTPNLAAISTAKADSVVAAQKAERAKAKKIFIAAVVIGALILLMLSIKIIPWIKHWTLVRSINKSVEPK